LISGGEYIGLVEVRSDSEETKNEISSAISASTKGLTLNADISPDFKRVMSNISRQYSTRIFNYQIGGEDTKIPQSIEDMITHAANFPPNVKQNFAKPLQAIFLDYGALEIPDEIDLIDVEQQKQVITDLWDLRLKYVEVLSNIEYVLQNPQQFQSFSFSELSQKANEIRKQINDITTSARQCANDYTSCLKSENLVDPEITLPERKPSQQLSSVKVISETSRLEISQNREDNSTDDLSSDSAIDYTRLRDLLAARNWRDADYETYLVMLKVVGREKGDSITVEELLNFSCTDLRTMDNLWVKYSAGRFGFSIQKKIYLEVGGKPDGKYYQEAWDKFGDRVGWRVNQDWINTLVTFDTTAPSGHLPSLLADCFPERESPSEKEKKGFGACVAWALRFCLFSRIETCKV
jgi:hypothetical protein